MSVEGLSRNDVTKMIDDSDENFERVVTKLSMRSLLDLVTALQHCMAQEQSKFDRLTAELHQINGQEPTQQYKSEQLHQALRRSQAILAKLCSRNMRCFTQQAVRARQDQEQITSESVLSQKRDNLKSNDNNAVKNRPIRKSANLNTKTNAKDHVTDVKDECNAINFSERLAFFQKQSQKERPVDKPKFIKLNNFTNANIVDDGGSCGKVFKRDGNVSNNVSRTPCDDLVKSGAAKVPNVDDILLSVKLLRESKKNCNGLEFVDDEHRQSSCWQGDMTGSDDDSVCTDQNAEFSDDSEKQFNHYEKLFSAEPNSDTYDGDVYEDRSSFDEDDFVEEEDDDDQNRYQVYMAHDPSMPVVDESGLEVILEEDENESVADSINENNAAYLSSDNPYKVKSKQIISGLQDGGDDSGVNDDQRSNSTFADDIDSLTGADTDSAKGSSTVTDVTSSDQLSPTSSLGVAKDPDVVCNNDVDKITKTNKVRFDDNEILNLSQQVDRIFSSCDMELVDNYQRVSLKPNVKTVQNGGERSHGAPKSEIRQEVPKLAQQISDVQHEWDPILLLKHLYTTRIPSQFKQPVNGHGNSENSEEVTKNGDADYINIEGYLEKLPSGRKKATFWNPWKKKYVKVKDGYLYYYENNSTEKETVSLQLMGGDIDTLDNNMIGVDDGKGHYIVLKCNSHDELTRWRRALLTHCQENFAMTYVQPVMYGLRSHKEIVIVDLGGASIRAGILADQPTVPQLFFPAICATDRKTGERLFGHDALNPIVRKNSDVTHPLLPQRSKYSIDVEAFPLLMKKIFDDLDVDPKHYQIQLCIPRTFSLQTLIRIATTLFDKFKVDGVNITNQSILSLYSYNATSGIVVDVGNRLDIIPVIDGYIVESGVTRTPYGGQRALHHLKQDLNHRHQNVSLESDAESFLVRYALEQLCFVAQDYEKELNDFTTDPDNLEKSAGLQQFNYRSDCCELSLDSGRFMVTEGLFKPQLWGLDTHGLHKQVQKAIKECSMDVRKEMTKSIYLCGGLTLLPGFADRLHKELDELTPPSISPTVHASPFRYHSSYVGACVLAASDDFANVMISSREWKTSGNACLSRWHR